MLKAPYSRMDFGVAEVLAKHNFLKSVEKKGKGPKRIISMVLDQKPIDGIKLHSKPSKRVYAGYKELRPVQRGYGISVLSTPKGVMTDKDARKNKVGGELLFEIW